jgi:serine/threonine protein kinase
LLALVYLSTIILWYVLQGLVKLADFGVAAKLGELEEQHCDELHQNVVGTPYWMAPEASGSSTARQLLGRQQPQQRVVPPWQRLRALPQLAMQLHGWL